MPSVLSLPVFRLCIAHPPKCGQHQKHRMCQSTQSLSDRPAGHIFNTLHSFHSILVYSYCYILLTRYRMGHNLVYPDPGPVGMYAASRRPAGPLGPHGASMGPPLPARGRPGAPWGPMGSHRTPYQIYLMITSMGNMRGDPGGPMGPMWPT